MTDHPTSFGGQAPDEAQAFDEAHAFEQAHAFEDAHAFEQAHAFDMMGAAGGERPCTSYTLRVNGGDRPVADAWIGESLLYVLRERLGLAGAKDGCEQGECGACSVQVDGQLVASCLVPAALAAGSDIQTVEGLAPDGTPSDVQRALAESGAVQCGYCIPGLAMAVHDLLQRNHRPSDVEAREALCGNLCRCTGYRGVLEAVRTVAEARTAAAAAPDPQPEAEAPSAPAAPAPEPAAGRPAARPFADAGPEQAPDQAAEPPVYAQIPHQQFPEDRFPGQQFAEGRSPGQQFTEEQFAGQQFAEEQYAEDQQPAPAGVDPLFGPLDAVLEGASAPPQQPMHAPPSGYGTYAPDPYGTGVYAEQPPGEGAYHPDPYRQSHGADPAPVPDLYTPDGQAAYDPAHGLGPQYGVPPDHGTPPYGTPAHGFPLPEDDRA